MELIGFTKRVFPHLGNTAHRSTSRDDQDATPEEDATEKAADEVPIRTEITFDFHRLNVLVLRAVMRDGFLLGRKVGTFTMSEARIHATLGETIVTVEGSLGGLQVLDLTPEGVNHQRILSVGKDPLTESLNSNNNDALMSSLIQEMYTMGSRDKTSGASSLEERQALSFVVSRDAQSVVNVRIRMASVWYTHCARFMQELNWCASEFLHYLKNLARSIREKAADMALGLVQARPDATPRVGGGLFQHGATDVLGSPSRNVLYRSTQRLSGPDEMVSKVEIRLDVILDTPVLVVPRSSCSTQVFVAHLGQISVSNWLNKDEPGPTNSSTAARTVDQLMRRDDSTIFTISEEDMEVNEILCGGGNDAAEGAGTAENNDYAYDMFQMDDLNINITNENSEPMSTSNKQQQSKEEEDQQQPNLDTYVIDVRNMNLFSLDTAKRKSFRLSALPRAEEFYSCKEEATAVLHDTAIRLEITRIVENRLELMADSHADRVNTLQITGSVIQPLQLSLSKGQYEQLLETFDNCFKVPEDLIRPPNQRTAASASKPTTADHVVDGGVELESKAKRRLFEQPSLAESKTVLEPKVAFNLPILKIELKNDKSMSMIEISFRDFSFNYERSNQFETNIQVSLRSLLMEDLLQPVDSKNRIMVISSSPDSNALRLANTFASISCPNLAGLLYNGSADICASLPENLERRAGFYPMNNPTPAKLKSSGGGNSRLSHIPETPPPSPQQPQQQQGHNQDNLVLYSSLIIDPACPTFASQYKSMRQSSSIDFNSLDLNVAVLSWFNLLEFFGLISDDSDGGNVNNKAEPKVEQEINKVGGGGNSELNISVRSLTVVLVKPAYEIARANVSNARFIVSKRGVTKMVEGSLGSMSLLDLSRHGNTYRERFVTSGTEALNFVYRRDQLKGNGRTLQKDARLKIQMSSVRYVHTKRFVMDIQIFFRDFLQLQTMVLRRIKPSSDSRLNLNPGRPTQLGLEIIAGSPIILLPMSANSGQLIVADLGNFTLKNTFKYSSDEGVISIPKVASALEAEILDVMTVDLVNTNLFAAVRLPKGDDGGGSLDETVDSLNMGGYVIVKNGPNLLQDKCHLKLQVERNMDTWKSHNVPDVSVQGVLSSVMAVLDLEQYKLVRGFLAYNLGECIDELYREPTFNITDSHLSLNVDRQTAQTTTWTNLAITLDLQNVSVQLQTLEPPNQENRRECQNLAGIDFIKSSLKIESFTDGSQDIDLVSQEILISDTRRSSGNVFESILKPIEMADQKDSFVQAEIYSRKKSDCSKYTILLNNMRLIAILDWLESMRDFLFQNADPPGEMTNNASNMRTLEDQANDNAGTFELVLNITDSELVFVENTALLDTNAVILRSTTILSYRPNETNKAMSINLNHLEVFSCILGSEEATALSIIDPMTVNLDIRKQVMDVQLQKRLCIRLSYNDMKMFAKMLESLPKQTRTARNVDDNTVTGRTVAPLRRANSTVEKLVALGFLRTDCEKALNICRNRLDEAALWLTQNVEPKRYGSAVVAKSDDPLQFKAIEVRASFISICVIDDCKDADVPLLEMSLSKLELRQEMGSMGAAALSSTTSNGFKAGHLTGVFSSDYYNRGLSGWEPLIEPWKCEAQWHYSLGQLGMQQNRLHLEVTGNNQLNFNVTSTAIELYQQVRSNWTEDYYEKNGKDIVHRRRTPFVPFGLRNDTGLRLWFSTMITAPGSREATVRPSNGTWTAVEPAQVVPFTFGAPTKLRHFDSHRLNLHQIFVRVDGWTEVGPVSVDRVGSYFRHARQEASGPNDFNVVKSRIVFAVTMEGSAQKLITVRSSLRLVNKLDTSVQVKLDHLYSPVRAPWPATISVIVKAQETYSVPVSHVHAFVYLRPTTLDFRFDEMTDVKSRSISATGVQSFNGNDYWTQFNVQDFGQGNTIYQYSDKPVHWKEMTDNVDVQQEYRLCKSNRDEPYRMVVAMRREKYPAKDNGLYPGHTLVFYPPLRIHNLLPCDLMYRLPSGTRGTVSSSCTANVHEADIDSPIELGVSLDGYPSAGQITIPAGLHGTSELKFKLTDMHSRGLILRATIAVSKGCGVQVSISASYWLVNRTGLPLIFKQEGVHVESSGQFAEHEQARLLTPLMFSFSDLDAPAALSIRLGKRYGLMPGWCTPINLQKDVVQHRNLRAASSNETFMVGLEVRRGRGRYAKTSVVTFSPRFQIYNRSSHRLQFAQKCFTSSGADSLARATFLEAVPDCHVPFHWPRPDKDQVLCVRLPDVPTCLWSGSIPIEESASYYVNVRNQNGDMHFLRLEIVLQGAMYFLLFGDAQVLPPPIRIDNYAEVPVKFFQPGCRYDWRTTVRPHSTMAYVLDEPKGPQSVQIEAPDGVSHSYSLQELNQGSHNLTYENFIYVAFTGTFQDGTTDLRKRGCWDDCHNHIENSRLVLGVIGDRVVLVRKQPGERSQLWRMNQERQLEHEGSSPPTEPGKKLNNAKRFVLDFERPPQPKQFVHLVVRAPNKQRKLTQTWSFTSDGRLMCEHTTMCVQAKGGFFGLRPGAEAVVGMSGIEGLATVAAGDNKVALPPPPMEQAIERQKYRPGSGCLSVVVTMDGPTKTIRIRDVKGRPSMALTIDANWMHVSPALQFDAESGSVARIIRELHVKLKVCMGMSIVSRDPYEELMYVTLEHVAMEYIATALVCSLDLSVDEVQIDNQLLESPCPVMLYTFKAQPANDSPSQRRRLSAIQLTAKMLPSPNRNAVIFEHLVFGLRPMAVVLEERLLLRMVDFMGWSGSQQDAAQLSDESDYEAQRVATKLMAANATRYYFGDLQIVPSQNRVSVITASKLSPRLAEVKKQIGLTLIKFEDAVIEFGRFSDRHHFETLEVYLRAIKAHYKSELKWQAGSILVSLDFLGNPMGLASDVSEGVSGLIFEGSVKSLVKNVTHGFSNSAAKLTETISDGLGRVVLDERDTEARQRILEGDGTSNNSASHLMAGVKGFGFGLLGGVTSIVKHTYTGAQNDGLPGFFSGLGMGLVGTVTKPVIGVLDLASETANAVREKSRSSHRLLPERKRHPRCVSGAPGGLLPPYSFRQAKGQHILYTHNRRDFSEQLLEYEPCLFEGSESRLRLIVSTENVCVFSIKDDVSTIIFSYHLR